MTNTAKWLYAAMDFILKYDLVVQTGKFWNIGPSRLYHVDGSSESRRIKEELTRIFQVYLSPVVSTF
jgi:hypothetical protein